MQCPFQMTPQHTMLMNVHWQNWLMSLSVHSGVLDSPFRINGLPCRNKYWFRNGQETLRNTNLVGGHFCTVLPVATICRPHATPCLYTLLPSPGVLKYKWNLLNRVRDKDSGMLRNPNLTRTLLLSAQECILVFIWGTQLFQNPMVMPSLASYGTTPMGNGQKPWP